MTTLSDLIERVEAAPGPDREFDAGIMATRGTHVLEKRGRDRKAWWYEVGGPDYRRLDPDGGGYFGLPRFTASIDAAMTLVPDGAAWAVTNVKGGFPADADFSASTAALSVNGFEFRADAATPALALCLASLRALQEKDIEHG